MKTSTGEDATHAYIGVYDGIVRMATVDTLDKSTRKDVNKAMKAGAIIERVTIEEARAALFTIRSTGEIAPEYT